MKSYDRNPHTGTLKNAAIVFNPSVITIQRCLTQDSDTKLFLELFFLPTTFENWQQILWGTNFEQHTFLKKAHTHLFNSLCSYWVQVLARKFPAEAPWLTPRCRRWKGTLLLTFQDPLEGFCPLPLQPPRAQPGCAAGLRGGELGHALPQTLPRAAFLLLYMPWVAASTVLAGGDAIPRFPAQGYSTISTETLTHHLLHHCQSQTCQSGCTSNPAGLNSHHDFVYAKSPRPRQCISRSLTTLGILGKTPAGLQDPILSLHKPPLPLLFQQHAELTCSEHAVSAAISLAGNVCSTDLGHPQRGRGQYKAETHGNSLQADPIPHTIIF